MIEEISISDIETYRLLYLDAKLKNAVLSRLIEELKLKVLQLEHEQSKNNKELLILGKKDLEQKANESFKKEISTIAEKYQINIEDCCYDDETGRLIFVGGP